MSYLKGFFLLNVFLVFAWPSAASVSDEIQQNHIFFTGGGARLDQSARDQIVTLGNILNSPLMNGACLKLVGYADATGGASVNRAISRSRAEAVAAALAERLDDLSRVQETDGVGASGFLTEVPSTDPHQRRVAIFAKDCDRDG